MLLGHGAVRVAAVVLVNAATENAHLVAFVEPDAEWAGGTAELTERCGRMRARRCRAQRCRSGSSSWRRSR